MSSFQAILLILSTIHGLTNTACLGLNFSLFGRNAFMEPDTQITGPLLANSVSDLSQNPEELGPYFEGDILLPLRLNPRNALLTFNIRWPRNTIPYEIVGNFSTKEIASIQWAIDQYHTRTCIRFKPRSNEKDYISIVNGKSGCWSSVGRIGGKQEVNFQTPNCIARRGTILHEFMHVLGFLHEHNRHDRDRFITLYPENIKENMMTAFEKISKQKAHGMGIGYDYTSVMHYSNRAFSKNGQPTIEAKMDTVEAGVMGQRNGFSAADVARINVMYICKKHNQQKRGNK